MKNKFSIAVILICLLTSCTETSKEAERNLDLLRSRALALDSIISIESVRLQRLDSTISAELRKAGKLDSVVSHESMRVDSLINSIYRKIERRQK